MSNKEPSSDAHRSMIVTLSAEERMALIALAVVQRRQPAEVATQLIRIGLEERGLLEREAVE